MIDRITEEEFAENLAKVVAEARRKGRPRLEHVAPPINLERLRKLNPGPLYEGFEEDVKRMRRGLEPLGAAKMRPVQLIADTRVSRTHGFTSSIAARANRMPL